MFLIHKTNTKYKYMSPINIKYCFLQRIANIKRPPKGKNFFQEKSELINQNLNYQKRIISFRFINLFII